MRLCTLQVVNKDHEHRHLSTRKSGKDDWAVRHARQSVLQRVLRTEISYSLQASSTMHDELGWTEPTEPYGRTIDRWVR